jgi:hypothetical protein
MTRRMVQFVVALALTGGSLRVSASEVKRVVTGVVTQSDGAVAATASVAIFPLQEQSVAGDLTWTRADSQGRFRLTLKPGRYVVRAKDEADGYPDPSFLLSADPNARFPEISVDETDVSGVRVTLGAQGALLEGSLTDRESQSPVSNGKVVIRDAHDHAVFVELTPDKAGHFQFTVPSKPLVISASAPGYVTAFVGNAEPVTFSGGEHRNITIELKHE